MPARADVPGVLLAEGTGGPRACSHFGYGAKLTELVLLGVLSLRASQRIYWDAVNLKARNLPAADALIHGTYRNGWKIA